MIKVNELDLKGAYKAQRFAVPFYLDEMELDLMFDVEIDNTYVKGYKLYLMFEDETGEYLLDGAVPTGFFTKAELKEFEKTIYGNEVKQELFLQKKSPRKN